MGTTPTSHHDGSCHLERHQCLRDVHVVVFEVSKSGSRLTALEFQI